MKILHICNDYCGSKVHYNLYRELDALGVEQTIYTYFRSNSCGMNNFNASSTHFIYRPILRHIHRVFYHKKQLDVYKDLRTQLSLSSESFDMTHATTLFSDGGLSLRIFREFHIPYVVSVRNTDINEFLGYAPHTWLIGLRVLLNAGKIVFISKALKEKFCRHPLIKIFLSSIEDKFIIQPNGIDNYWLQNLKTQFVSDNHNVLYVGRFDHNKNVMTLIKSVLGLRRQYPDIQLHLVGGGISGRKS